MKSKLLWSTVVIFSVVGLSIFQNCGPSKFGTQSSSSLGSSVPAQGSGGSEQPDNANFDQSKATALLLIL